MLIWNWKHIFLQWSILPGQLVTVRWHQIMHFSPYTYTIIVDVRVGTQLFFSKYFFSIFEFDKVFSLFYGFQTGEDFVISFDLNFLKLTFICFDQGLSFCIWSEKRLQRLVRIWFVVFSNTLSKVLVFVIDEKFLGKRFKSQNFDESSERECTYTFSKSLLYTP